MNPSVLAPLIENPERSSDATDALLKLEKHSFIWVNIKFLSFPVGLYEQRSHFVVSQVFRSFELLSQSS